MSTQSLYRRGSGHRHHRCRLHWNPAGPDLLTGIPASKFLAVCDIDGDKAEALAAPARPMRGRPIRQIIKPEVDCVIVARPRTPTIEPAVLAVMAGKHLLIEKPLTIEPTRARSSSAMAEEYGVMIYTGFTQRFRRRYLAIKEHINKGYIGDVTSAKATIYLTQAVAALVISRARSTTPSINTMTYLFDC